MACRRQVSCGRSPRPVLSLFLDLLGFSCAGASECARYCRDRLAHPADRCGPRTVQNSQRLQNPGRSRYRPGTARVIGPCGNMQPLSAGGPQIERYTLLGAPSVACKECGSRVKVTLPTALLQSVSPPRVVQAVEQPFLRNELCCSCRFAILPILFREWTKEPSSSFAPLP
jgi:hypothetical protein